VEKMINVNQLRAILGKHFGKNVYVEAVIINGERYTVGMGQTCNLILDLLDLTEDEKMMKIIDYNKQINELEGMKSDVEQRIWRLKEQKKIQDAIHHDIATGIKLKSGSQYAELYCQQYHFHYGSQHTHCPVHGLDARCGCQDEGPAFTVHDTEGRLLFCRPQRLLAPGAIHPKIHLLHGIGQFFDYLYGGRNE